MNREMLEPLFTGTAHLVPYEPVIGLTSEPVTIEFVQDFSAESVWGAELTPLPPRPRFRTWLALLIAPWLAEYEDDEW